MSGKQAKQKVRDCATCVAVKSSSLLIAVTKMLGRKPVHRGRVNFVLQVKKVQSIMAGKAWQEECVAVHIWEEQEAKR